MRSSRVSKISAQSSAKRDAQKWKDEAPLFRKEHSPIVFPSSRVLYSGLVMPSGHSNVSIAACMMKRKSTGPSQLPCRTPMGVGGKGPGATHKKGAPFRRHYLIPRVARFIRSNRDELRAALLYLERESYSENTGTLTDRSRPVPLLLYRNPGFPLLESQTESQAGP